MTHFGMLVVIIHHTIPHLITDVRGDGVDGTEILTTVTTTILIITTITTK